MKYTSNKYIKQFINLCELIGKEYGKPLKHPKFNKDGNTRWRTGIKAMKLLRRINK